MSESRQWSSAELNPTANREGAGTQFTRYWGPHEIQVFHSVDVFQVALRRRHLVVAVTRRLRALGQRQGSIQAGSPVEFGSCPPTPTQVPGGSVARLQPQHRAPAAERGEGGPSVVMVVVWWWWASRASRNKSKCG